MLNADSMPARVRLVIADDHELVRRGLRMVLEAEPDMEIVDEASTCEEAIAATVEHRPDVLLLDLRMPGGGGVHVCEQVLQRCPDTRVVVLSTFDDEADVDAVMEAGASGYLLKDVPPETLARSLRSAAEGSVVMNPDVARRLLRARSAPAQPAPADPLSPRELEVLELLARGCKNRDIAREMWISESTVKTHVGHVIQKLGQRDRIQAVLYAIRTGIVSVDPS